MQIDMKQKDLENKKYQVELSKKYDQELKKNKETEFKDLNITNKLNS